MAGRDYGRGEDTEERHRYMEAIEGDRDRRERDAFRGSGYGDHGPAGMQRAQPSGRERHPDEADRRVEGRSGQDRGGRGETGAPDQRRAAFRGRGPRGYKRSDERIQEEINDRLTDDRQVDATEIQVQVSGGEATLTGNVDSRADRRRAEDIAESVSGVSYVMNNLRVRQAGTSGATG